MNKKELLISLAIQNVKKINCGSHCDDNWSISWMLKNLEDYRIIKIEYSDDDIDGIGYTLAHKDHLVY